MSYGMLAVLRLMVSRPRRSFSPTRLKASLAPALATFIRLRWYEYQVAKLVISPSSLRPVGVSKLHLRQSYRLLLLLPYVAQPALATPRLSVRRRSHSLFTTCTE